jgi:hypothetical protein
VVWGAAIFFGLALATGRARATGLAGWADVIWRCSRTISITVPDALRER